jgi:hypothetical protein
MFGDEKIMRHIGPIGRGPNGRGWSDGFIHRPARGAKGPKIKKPLPKYSDVKRAVQPPKEAR